MSQAKILQEKAEMFERRAEARPIRSRNSITRRWRRITASLAVEHLEVHRDEPAH